jgi:hypothetical protein
VIKEGLLALGFRALAKAKSLKSKEQSLILLLQFRTEFFPGEEFDAKQHLLICNRCQKKNFRKIVDGNPVSSVSSCRELPPSPHSSAFFSPTFPPKFNRHNNSRSAPPYDIFFVHNRISHLQAEFLERLLQHPQKKKKSNNNPPTPLLLLRHLLSWSFLCSSAQ